ncbi:MAG TPA: ABC transporter permease, partial [Blastocatellia bacterium]|nr:ABC transporter permease [Blastocatellia bacterium]
MNRLGKVGLAIISALLFVAIFAPLLAPYDPREQTRLEINQPTEERLKPTREFIFGRDDLGRDVLSRVMYGARISMRVGASVVLISAVIGTFIGAISGYYGGWVDRFLSGFLFNVFLP